MANLVLRVTPETLEKKAAEFTGIINEIKGHFDQIEAVSARTKGYWLGAAGDKDRAGYASYKDDINYIIHRLQEHPTDLLSMAGIYREAERDVAGKNAALKTDQIV